MSTDYLIVGRTCRRGLKKTKMKMKTKLKKTKMTKTKKMTKMRRIRMRKMVKIRRTRRKMEPRQERRKRKSLAFVFFCERKREITKLETLQFVLLLAW